VGFPSPSVTTQNINSNRPQTANLTPSASIQNVCRLQILIEPQRSEGRDNKGANRHRGGSGGNFPRMRQPWRNTSTSFAQKGGRGRRIAPLESTGAHAIKRGQTQSKIPPWRAPGRGGGVSPHKKKHNHAKYQNNPPADCTRKPLTAKRGQDGKGGCRLFYGFDGTIAFKELVFHGLRQRRDFAVPNHFKCVDRRCCQSHEILSDRGQWRHHIF